MCQINKELENEAKIQSMGRELEAEISEESRRYSNRQISQ
jgi:hypothetical protein